MCFTIDIRLLVVQVQYIFSSNCKYEFNQGRIQEMGAKGTFHSLLRILGQCPQEFK